MNTRDYFTYPSEVQRHLRRRTLVELEELYSHMIMDGAIEEDVDFIDFLNQTIKDMVTLENYEGAQVLIDIKRYQGWR